MAIYPLQVKIFLPKIGYGGPKGLTSTPYKWSYMCVNKKGYLPPCDPGKLQFLAIANTWFSSGLTLRASPVRERGILIWWCR